jgi:hypothetical protein
MSPIAEFAALQQGLPDRLGDEAVESWARTIVVCPSVTFPEVELRKITGIQHYEERLLYLALLLADPGLELCFPSSVTIDAEVVDYYLRWLPDPADARQRLHLFPVGDDRPSSLSDKLLARPEVLAAVRERITDPQQAVILPFNVTESEAAVAEALGVPLYGTAPELAALGSKSGARHIAAEAGVAVFSGEADLYSLDAIARAAEDIVRARPQTKAVVAKLNNGFSGQGNVIIEAADVRLPLERSLAVFCAAEESWETFGPKVAAEGAIVEELARVPGLRSPSVQLRITPGGWCEVVSTHDQILGGPDEQVYVGCRFPADPAYRAAITDAGLRVARVLAARGALGSFGIDFVVVPDEGVYLSEINLRLGGTTHPFHMARLVSGGVYDKAGDELLVEGEPRVYLGSDNIKSPRYEGLAPAELIAAVDAAGLDYDAVSRTGVTLHLLGALERYGKWGVVCIARTHAEADALYEQTVACVDALADRRREDACGQLTPPVAPS